MKSLKPRLLTAVIGIPMLILFLLLAEVWMPVVAILVALATAFMTGEYLNANKLLKSFAVSAPCLLFSLSMPFFISTAYVYLAVVLYMLVMFIVMILSHRKITYSELAYSVTGTLLISLGMSAIPLMCSSKIGILFYFITIFALPWMADAGGFFIGVTLGKHKLCPSISPKKTVEGVIGGVVFCVISAVLVGLLFQYLITPNIKINFFALILLGVIDAPISIVGDLGFSLIKRRYNIKDYGSIFPGHGGMLDRFDSIIFTAPVIVLLNQLIPIITVV
ncbi:MAG: phosphatidate cytidylyltransferase [Ruminococcus sp.]|nr:phosphatidate cytidylyltransferase [Ruminococcus sp.]